MLRRNNDLINKMKGVLKKNNELGMMKLAKELNCSYGSFKNIIKELENENIITIKKIGSKKQIIFNSNENVQQHNEEINIDGFTFKVVKSIIGDVILTSELAKYLGIKSTAINDIINKNEDNFVDKVGKSKVGKTKRVSINKKGVMELYKLMLCVMTPDMNNKFVKLVNATKTQLSEERIQGENLTYNKELDEKVNRIKILFNEVIDDIANDMRKICTENNYLKEYNDKLALDGVNQQLRAESKLEVLEAGINKLRNAKIQAINNKYSN